MARKITTKDFVLKATNVHKNKYDYSKVEYVNAKTKVIIICPTHGEFLQTPNGHTQGKGCPKCGSTKYAKSTEQFIVEAKAVHGTKYDYSKVKYVNSCTKVAIICKIHGEFLQRPKGHLEGNDCAKCMGRHKHTTSEFIAKANVVHNYKFDYSDTVYKTGKYKIVIICPVHGKFEQEAESHLRGQGCAKCNSNYKLTTKEFIIKAKKVHGTKYKYSKSVYTGSQEKLTITCPEHGDFEQIANGHLYGFGCIKCAQDSNRMSKEEFVDKANKVHNNKFNYDKVVYINNCSKVTIVCPIHGDFEQTPAAHTSAESGCPYCAKTGFDKTKPGTLYYLKVLGGTAYKIGITNRTIQERFSQKELEIIETLQTWNYTSGADAYNKEQQILRDFKPHKYVGPDILESGNTELFYTDVLCLDEN